MRRGLTLTELLMVLAVLGAMTSGIVPSVHFILTRAQGQDVRERLATSWQLAAAMSRAQQRPVIWRLAPGETNVQITILDGENAVLWSATIIAQNLRIKTGDSESDQPNVSFVMYPHGLTDSIIINWDMEGQTQQLTLGGNVPAESKTNGVQRNESSAQ